MLISGVNDWLADPDDVDILRSQLSVRPLKDYVISFQLWNHADFLVGTNRGREQNSIILQWLYEFFGNVAHDHHYNNKTLDLLH
ncbi:hypothetical protein BLA29_014464 [Euroglyphus maynei]|uniref:Uncharacterized protein n=1 Tax=Euroglyphus maynei TaxID=6958 RepID=A0A1Y3AXS0_EURMA|nr:hypothetical protein BLA29_014464 [Euroglyphus maynei]